MAENTPRPSTPESMAPSDESKDALTVTTIPEQQTSSEHDAERQQTIEASRQTIDKEATPAAHTPIESAPASTDSFLLTKALKDEAFQERLAAVQRRLGRPARLFSTIIHQPAIDSLSRAAEKTIARPGSLLAGALFAFAGTTLVVILSRRYGFYYNYFVLVLFFAGGWCIGTIVAPFARRLFKR